MLAAKTEISYFHYSFHIYSLEFWLRKSSLFSVYPYPPFSEVTEMALASGKMPDSLAYLSFFSIDYANAFNWKRTDLCAYGPARTT